MGILAGTQDTGRCFVGRKMRKTNISFIQLQILLTTIITIQESDAHFCSSGMSARGYQKFSKWI